ncbi:DUF6053 domain-containing protein [Lysobacter enzymogenes]|uniref:DUF6053 domain-containing protein n=1 Tax=Lysobacter enzymogenes TaxID=69 RepID=UPI003D18EEFD
MGGASAPTPLCPIAANRAESPGPEGPASQNPKGRSPVRSAPRIALIPFGSGQPRGTGCGPIAQEM